VFICCAGKLLAPHSDAVMMLLCRVTLGRTVPVSLPAAQPWHPPVGCCPMACAAAAPGYRKIIDPCTVGLHLAHAAPRPVPQGRSGMRRPPSGADSTSGLDSTIFAVRASTCMSRGGHGVTRLCGDMHRLKDHLLSANSMVPCTDQARSGAGV
jgi:hypothetical protein